MRPSGLASPYAQLPCTQGNEERCYFKHRRRLAGSKCCLSTTATPVPPNQKKKIKRASMVIHTFNPST